VPRPKLSKFQVKQALGCSSLWGYTTASHPEHPGLNLVATLKADLIGKQPRPCLTTQVSSLDKSALGAQAVNSSFVQGEIPVTVVIAAALRAHDRKRSKSGVCSLHYNPVSGLPHGFEDPDPNPGPMHFGASLSRVVDALLSASAITAAAKRGDADSWNHPYVQTDE
jgi:hypothetical protein